MYLQVSFRWRNWAEDMKDSGSLEETTPWSQVFIDHKHSGLSKGSLCILGSSKQGKHNPRLGSEHWSHQQALALRVHNGMNINC